MSTTLATAADLKTIPMAEWLSLVLHVGREDGELFASIEGGLADTKPLQAPTVVHRKIGIPPKGSGGYM